MFKMKSLLLIAIFCFGLVLPGCTQESKVAPEISAGKWFNAESFSLADNKDKIVVVEFWATWCPPCRKSIPHLKEMSEKYADKNVVFVSLSNEPAATVEKFMAKTEMPWIIGAESQSGQAYGVTGIPSAFIIVDGKIVWNGHPMGGLEEELEKVVAGKGATSEGAGENSPENDEGK
ncbi:MAG: TlpA disulfide reductase family protein [Candidatus Rifleibacteriota bacterium]